MRILTPAPPRYQIDAPMRYRPAGRTQWIEAEAINVSQNGVLFYCDELLPVGSELDLYLVLRTDTTEFPPLTICVGTVTRLVERLADSRAAMAVQFTQRQTLAIQQGAD